MEEFEPTAETTRSMHWSLRLALSLAFAVGALACLLGACILIFDPRSENPWVARTAGLAMAFVSAWVLSVAYRLLLNRPKYGGLLAPLTLRLVATYMAAMPTFMLVTGRTIDWTWPRYLQAAVFIFGAIGIWRLAAWRQASNFRA